MKYLLIAFLFLSCIKKNSEHKKETKSTAKVAVKKPLALKIEGLELNYESAKKTVDGFTEFLELEIMSRRNPSSKQLFGELAWGAVRTTLGENSINVHLVKIGDKDIFNVKYFANEDGTLGKQSECTIDKKPEDDASYKEVLKFLDGPEADGETGVYRLFGIAQRGNKKAYDFFMDPDSKQKKYHRFNDGAASFGPVQSVLRFMKAHGCRW